MGTIGTSTFNITADLEYFSSDEACSNSLTSFDDIVGKIAVTHDYSVCNTSRKIANAQLFGAVGVIVINSRNDGAPNIVWYTADSRGLSEDDINMPVLGVGFTDGAVLFESISNEENTWRTGVEIYKHPNYTISNTRRCAAPRMLTFRYIDFLCVFSFLSVLGIEDA